MRKTITQFLTVVIMLTLFGAQNLFAQKSHTIVVGWADENANYTSLFDAIRAVSDLAEVEDGDTIIINMLEEIHYEQGGRNLNFRKPIHIVINGVGAGKTIIQHPTAEERPPLDGTAGQRLWTVNNAACENGSITFQNLTIKWYGTASGGNSSGGFLNYNNFFYTARFKNVIFDECIGLSLVNTGRKSDFEFDNVLFLNCVSTIRTDAATPVEGLISMKDGGNLTIRNTTFYNNTFNNPPSETNLFAGLTGGLVSYTWRDDETIDEGNIIIENVAAVNNFFVDEAHDTIQPLIALYPRELTALNVSLKDNIFIGNHRPGKADDVDILARNRIKVAFDPTSSGNIMNSAVKQVMVGFGEDAEYAYEELIIPGTLVSEEYAYTHPGIMFTMDGDIPMLLADEYGIGYVQYTGDGGFVSVNMTESSPLKIYAFSNILRVEGLTTGENLEIYTITGSLFARKTISGDTFEMEMPKGIYIVRAGLKAQKVLIH